MAYLYGFPYLLSFVFNFFLVSPVLVTHAVSPFDLFLYSQQQIVRIAQPVDKNLSVIRDPCQTFDQHQHANRSLPLESASGHYNHHKNESCISKWDKLTSWPKLQSYYLAAQVSDPSQQQIAPDSTKCINQ